MPATPAEDSLKLCELLKNVDYQLFGGDTDQDVVSLTCDSREARPGSVFFAIEGANVDGRDFIDEATRKGATAVVLQKDVRKTLAHIACTFYNNPSEQLQMIGVTGTKGKTSVTFLIQHILEAAGIKTGIIGTVRCGYEGNYQKSTITTPGPLELQKILRDMADSGCKAVVMEVSSQGLMQNRVDGIKFNIGVFTNIFADHIRKGEHENFCHYLECKSRLFESCQKAVINGDDDNWSNVVKSDNLKRKIFYGRDAKYNFYFFDTKPWSKEDALGIDFKVKAKAPFDNEEERQISLKVPGNFNGYNGLAAIATARALGIPWDIIQSSLETAFVPGRTELVPLGKSFTALVDYAHNGVALSSLLTSLREYQPNRLIVVFGAGGNRDKNRRFEMGKAAYQLADYIIITSDNPRMEDPKEIIKDITSVMDFCHKPILVIPDRKAAIERAIREGQEGDIIVIAGKGHETYQIIEDKVIDFDDKQVILSCGKDLR